MRVVDVITKKRNGDALTDGEISTLIRGYTKGNVPDYQMAALLMAVFLRGMNDSETTAMTKAMAESGDMVDLSHVPGVKVDKHSTGGVADTTTLVLAPLVAAAGVPVAKMSGRGLGFTGGTIDKLEAIPGFRTTLTRTEFIDNLQRLNLAVTGQTADIAPADGKIYALRDVTATVESIPLIASSIMSKKIAAGADKILLDVKVGSGAFMKNFDDAVMLAKTMVRIGNLVGRETKAVLTSMNEPLGKTVGNSLEVLEAIDVLSGRGSPALKHVCLTLGAHMLLMAGTVPNTTNGYEMLNELLENKAGLKKFQEFITAQGGNPDIVIKPDILPQAEYQIVVKSNTSGFVKDIDAAQIGYSAMILGAGREYKGQEIDLGAGLVLQCRVGDYVEKDQPLVVLHTNNQSKLEEAKLRIIKAISIGSEKVQPTPLILGVVDGDGFHAYE